MKAKFKFPEGLKSCASVNINSTREKGCQAATNKKTL